jgi:hypothetical protein
MSQVRVVMEVVASGRAVEVVFKIGVTTVQVFCRDRRIAVLERQEVRDWLADTRREVMTAGHELILVTPKCVPPALVLGDVGLWTLAPSVLGELRARV